MSLIQNIRDKYARIAVIAIALSLVGFILMDALSGRSNLFSGNETTIGEINGEEIDYLDFDKRLKAQEEQYKAQGYDMGDNRQQLVEGAWNAELMRVLLGEEYKKLGITVSDKEVNDYLFGANPPQDLRQQFTDSTGQYNAARAVQTINQMRKSGTPEQKANFDNYLAGMRNQRQFEKYTALLAHSVYVPKWFAEKQLSDASLVAKTAYVNVPYATIADSTVKVSDDEIRRYIDNHRTEFEQKEESRGISYVLFPAAPSATDSAAAQQALLQLKPAFDSAANYEEFLRTNNSTMPFYNGLLNKSAIQQPNKEAILAQPVGTTYGPYLETGQGGRNFWVMSKVLEARAIPDTVTARHILIGTSQQDPQSGQRVAIRDDSTAKRLADSVRGLLAAGQSFDSLVARFSDDPGSKQTGGKYENIAANGQMVPTFSDYIFTAGVGQVGVVKTDFGYHIIEVLSQKGASTGYKVAYFGRPIEVSAETENAAANAANQFANDSRSVESFNQNYDKNLRTKGLNKQVADNITPLSYNIPGIGVSRELVRNIFSATRGEVLQPQRITAPVEGYVVAVVTSVNKPGLMSVNAARPGVEVVLRNQKKAAQIRKNIGAISTLEAVSQKVSQPVVNADSVRFAGNNNNALGFEYKVIGAAFNPANKGKVVPEPIDGQAGVYVLRVDGISGTVTEFGNAQQYRQVLQQQARQQAQNQDPLTPLKARASIKDNRAKFY
ncbi:peptidylprolyl isomerase [Flaviaesturariibacter amylovorans]|uniref:Periplasmic chaperone PpiD n=1 Tax=Flaviaesturariibacter amylovorans TaxID=1084520 RepID=A0ABP8HDL2_9BACT